MWDTGCQRNPLSICCLGSTQCETDSFVMERGGVARMSGVGRSGRGTVSALLTFGFICARFGFEAGLSCRCRGHEARRR